MSETHEPRSLQPDPKPADGERRMAVKDALDVEPLMTVCPNCATRFRVTEAQLQAARGRVRCGSCNSVFDGVDQLVLDGPREFTSSHDAAQALDELMAELMADRRVMPPPQAAEQVADEGSAVRNRSAAEDAEAPGLSSEVPVPDVQAAEGAPPEMASLDAGATGQVDELATTTSDVDATIAVQETPAFGEPVAASDPSVPATVAPVVFDRPRNRGLLWFVLFAPLGLAATAALVLWLRFDTLSREPAWRPTYERVCPIVGCELPVRRAVALVRPRNLTVQSAGEGSGALLVRVSIVNEAEFAQPFPVLQLSFSDLDGLPIAGHRFQPREYLAGDARDLALMPVKAPVQLELRVPDPGANAVNYQLDLL